MRILEGLHQGSDLWHAHRAKSRNASEAPAVMGVSKYKTRSELLREKATGIADDVDATKQRLFDRGHETESSARLLVEEMIADDLYPVVAESDDGYLSASFDGVNMENTVIFEHKLYSDDLAAQVRAGDLDPHYYWQLEHQLIVSGAEKVVFVCSDGTSERFCSLEYRPVPGRAEQLLSAWRQFDADLASYEPTEVLPAPVAAPIADLPALMVEISGRVLSSNLVQWQGIVTERIASINTDLQTDQDFANAEETVKFLDDGEKKLDLVKSQAQAQAADIDTLFRAVDAIKAEMRAKRLELDRLVKARKEAIRVEILREGETALRTHIDSLNARLGKPYMPVVPHDFAGAMRGKKTISSLRAAVDHELTRAKMAASEIADRIQVNLNTLRELAVAHAFLFADTAAIIQKAPDDLAALVKLRIAEHREAEEKRLEEERTRIRAEEQAKIDAKNNSAAAAASPAAATANEGTGETPAPGQRETPSAAVAAITPADDGRTIKLGDINARLAPLSITADGLAQLGFTHVATEKSAKLYKANSFHAICAALARHIDKVSFDHAMKEAA